MTDKEKINPTALKPVYRILRETFNWAVFMFVRLSYWSTGVQMCPLPNPACACLGLLASVLCMDCVCIHTCTWARLLYVCVVDGKWGSDANPTESEASLVVHKTLAMKNVQFCKMIWQSDGSPSRFLQEGGRPITEVQISIFLKRCSH